MIQKKTLKSNGNLRAPTLDHEHCMFPLLLTEDEVIDLLRIPEVSKAADYHNVIENLKRVRGLPCIYISRKPLYPFTAFQNWLEEEAEKDRNR
jgi:hypothetical protein